MEIKGDFLGFTFAGVRSESLGIVRTSDGDRFEEELTPEIKDITAEVPGMDGEYYFGSTYGSKTIDVSFAFDSLTEEQFRKLRQVYGRRKQGELIFDERPYKKYMVKIASPIELSYVCFDEPKRVPSKELADGVRVVNRTSRMEQREVPKFIIDEETQEKVPVYVIDEETGEPTDVQETEIIEVEVYDIEREKIAPWVYELDENGEYVKERIYKGEGTISFIAYFPFAKSTFKVLPEAGQQYYEGRDDWAVSSGILSADVRNDKQIDVFSAGVINVYNAGDLDTGFRLYCPGVSGQLRLDYSINNELIASLLIDEFETEEGDNGFLIDTNTGLIVGIKNSTMKVVQLDENDQEIEVIEVDQPIHVDYHGNVYYTTSGHLYNQYVKLGSFFKLQPNIEADDVKITISGVSGTPQIFYDYLYF